MRKRQIHRRIPRTGRERRVLVTRFGSRALAGRDRSTTAEAEAGMETCVLCGTPADSVQILFDGRHRLAICAACLAERDGEDA